MPAAQSYSPATAVLLNELLKGSISFVIAFFRQRHSRHDFADKYKNPAAYHGALKTVGQTGKRVFGRPFVTAGWIVALLSYAIAAYGDSSSISDGPREWSPAAV